MKKLFFASFLALSLFSKAQVGIGTTTANASSVLDVTSTTKGVLFPRMTAAQRSAITLPAAAQGLMVYQTDGAEGFYYNTSTTTTASWMYLANSSSSVAAGTVVPYAGSTVPAGWALCNGQSLSRTTYATLFGAIGTTYGTIGSAEFSVPDVRGRTVFGNDVMGATAANRLTTAGGGIDGATAGATGGTQNVTIGVTNMPAHNHAAGTLSAASAGSDHQHNYADAYYAENVSGGGTGNNSVFGQSATSDNDNSFRFRKSDGTAATQLDTSPLTVAGTGAHTHTITGSTANAGSAAALPVTNPGIVLNYIIKL